jgi:peptidylprolyl isomerase
LLVVACGPAATPEATDTASDGEETVAAPTSAPVESGATAAPAPEGPAPGFEDLDYTTTDSGLQIAIVSEGDGEQAEAGDVVRVHYTGYLGDGTVFDSSRDRGEPFQFPLGQGQVIAGWDEGIALMNAGDQAKLVIPSEIAYGPQGSGPIPANATLYFDVELLEVLEGGPDEPADVDEYETTESGLEYSILEEGDGAMPEEGDPVRVHYTIWLEDGTRLVSSLDRAEPFTFPVGEGRVFPGWEEGMTLMEEGAVWQFLVPPELGLGEEGAGEVVPPDATLILQVQLLDVLPRSPAEPETLSEDEYVTTDSGLQYAELEEGDGATVESGNTVIVHYTGWLTDGTKFDSSYDRGEPFRFIPGAGQVIPGWEEGVIGMSEGGIRQLLIPADLAYGDQGAAGVIPPGATLIFRVELIEVEETGN